MINTKNLISEYQQKSRSTNFVETVYIRNKGNRPAAHCPQSNVEENCSNSFNSIRNQSNFKVLLFTPTKNKIIFLFPTIFFKLTSSVAQIYNKCIVKLQTSILFQVVRYLCLYISFTFIKCNQN